MEEVCYLRRDRVHKFYLISVATNVFKGLQCHTAPFSWKVVFEYDHQLFELTMTACSPKEELEWRSRLMDRIVKECLVMGDQAAYASLSLNIRPMGVVFGKPGECLEPPTHLVNLFIHPAPY